MLEAVWRTYERLLRKDKNQDSFPARQLFVLGTSRPDETANTAALPAPAPLATPIERRADFDINHQHYAASASR
jgi:hypothetical protein